MVKAFWDSIKCCQIAFQNVTWYKSCPAESWSDHLPTLLATGALPYSSPNLMHIHIFYLRCFKYWFRMLKNLFEFILMFVNCLGRCWFLYWFVRALYSLHITFICGFAAFYILNVVFLNSYVVTSIFSLWILLLYLLLESPSQN